MSIQRVLLAAAAVVTLAAPAAALADPHDGFGDHRADVQRGYDARDGGVRERREIRDRWYFRHHHHHHRWEHRRWR